MSKPKQFLEKVSYKIDGQNKIIEVYDSWEKAAEVGKAAKDLDPNQIIDKYILSYVSGDLTKVYYYIMYTECRRLQKKLSLTYRCDSPTHKRFMEMEMTPGDQNTITIENYLLKEEPFEHPINIKDETDNLLSLTQILRCAICNSLKIEGEWLLPESVIAEKEKEYRVIHTICPTCQENKMP